MDGLVIGSHDDFNGEICLAAVHAKSIAMSQHSTQETKRNGFDYHLKACFGRGHGFFVQITNLPIKAPQVRNWVAVMDWAVIGGMEICVKRIFSMKGTGFRSNSKSVY